MWLQKRYENKFFFAPLSFVAVLGSGIRDPGWVKMRIRDKHPGAATLRVSLLGLLKVDSNDKLGGGGREENSNSASVWHCGDRG